MATSQSAQASIASTSFHPGPGVLLYLAGAYLTMSASTVSLMFVPYLLGTAIDEALATGVQGKLLVLAG